MAGANRFVVPNAFVVGSAGPLAGAKLYFYATGTTTPQNTYQDAGLSIANVNPVIANALGQFGNVFLLSSPSYRVTLTDADDAEVWTMDPVGPTISAAGAVPIGGLVPFAGTTVPSGYLLCYGQAVSRSTYSALFGVIGILWGAGDASTTFNVPDLRGRGVAGRDDMGGSAASRLTSGGSGVDGLTVGAVGGNQLLASHTHAVTDPGHIHAVTDPGHKHAPGEGSFVVFVSAGTGVNNVTFGADVDGANYTADQFTGVTVNSHVTGLTIAAGGTGASANVQPTGVINWIINTG